FQLVRVLKVLPAKDLDRADLLFEMRPVDGGEPYRFVAVVERNFHVGHHPPTWRVAAIAEPVDGDIDIE
ncbi:MAG: hypothetical protein KDA41_05945, partial [Planctomycetales bacterium]|nr:hypothetical protein [Planctomycetales bacterium]